MGRGLFAELQREIARQQRQQHQARAAAVRQSAAAEREAERRYRAAMRDAQQAERANARAHIEAVKAQQLAYTQARVAQTDAMTAAVQAQIVGLDQLLAWTLNRDDHVAFESLKKRASHPPFDAQGTDIPRRAPTPPLEPAEPRWDEYAPPEPKAVAKVFGGRSRHMRATQMSQTLYEAAHNEWRGHVTKLRQDFVAAQNQHRRDEQSRLGQLQELRSAYERQCQEQDCQAAEHNGQIDVFAEAYYQNDPQAVIEYYTIVLGRSSYPEGFPQQFRVAYVPESAQLVVEYELPTIAIVPRVVEYRHVKTKDEQTAKARTQKDIRAQYASVVAQVALRTVHELFEADRGGVLGTIIFNGIVRTTDPSTGKAVQPCLVTVRATRDAFNDLDLAHVDPLACLAHMSASVSKRPDELAPVRPVLEFDMVDKRFVEESDVLSDLDQRPNLLELTPTEFESLIQNLFAKMGLDTKQTQASRDGGVDCVAFDPRPIFGGKVVIQAKRYRHTVEVSAVRDLYGTLQNEGASKGILVTTSGYGQASHQFAAGKPIELIDGSNLLYLLAEYADVEARIVGPAD